MADEQRRKEMEEESRREERERIAAEKEFLEQHERQRKLSTQRQLSAGAAGGFSSANSSQADSESEAEGKKRARNKVSPEDKAKRTKPRRSEDDENDGDEEEITRLEDPLKDLSVVLSLMRGWFRQPAIMKMVTKPQTEKFATYLAKFQEDLMRAREERARMEGRVEERKAIVEIVSGMIRSETEKRIEQEEPKVGGSYSAALRRESSRVPRVTGMKGPIVQPPKQVIVRHATKESDEVTKILKKVVKPSEIGLKVRRLINIRNGVIVEAETEEGAENLTRQEALKKEGLKVERPEKKKPFIMVYDVGANLTDEDIKEEVFVRNMGGSEIRQEEFMQEFEVRHKYKDRRLPTKKCHVVVECSVRVRNWLRGKERVFVEWQSCRVKDYMDVARCFKCQRFGHVAKHCKNEKPSCSHCAGDHDYKECKDKDKKEKVCCVNCRRDKKEDCKHDAGSRNCPAYEKAVKRQNEKIDYGL